MPSQKLLSEYKNKITNDDYIKAADVLDIEQKYFDMLWSLFTSESFVCDLKKIEEQIQVEYDFLQITWNLKNKLKIPAERLTRFYVYRELTNIIKSIYPSAVSGDIAFITEDAVINIDIKTLDKVGNAGDIKNLQFLSNQFSFENKDLDSDPGVPGSGVHIIGNIPSEYEYAGKKLPVLTYFLTFVYCDNGTSFTLCRNDDEFDTISLKCLPNGLISFLFDNDIIDNLKSYNYLDRGQGFIPRFLTDHYFDVDDAVKQFARDHKDEGYILINGRTKLGVFNYSEEHPRYHTLGVSWFPVRRKSNNGTTGFDFYLEAVDGPGAIRIKNSTLIERYNSKDELWYGIKNYSF